MIGPPIPAIIIAANIPIPHRGVPGGRAAAAKDSWWIPLPPNRTVSVKGAKAAIATQRDVEDRLWREASFVVGNSHGGIVLLVKS